MSSTQHTISKLTTQDKIAKDQSSSGLTHKIVMDILGQSLNQYDGDKGILEKIGRRNDSPVIQKLKKFHQDLKTHVFNHSDRRELLKLIMEPTTPGNATHDILSGLKKQIFAHLTPAQRLALPILSQHKQINDVSLIALFDDNINPRIPYALQDNSFKKFFSELTHAEREHSGHTGSELFWNTLSTNDQITFLHLYNLEAVNKHMPTYRNVVVPKVIDTMSTLYSKYKIDPNYWAIAAVTEKKQIIALTYEKDKDRCYIAKITTKVNELRTQGILAEDDTIHHYTITPINCCNRLERYVKSVETTHKNHFTQSLDSLKFFPTVLLTIMEDYDTATVNDALRQEVIDTPTDRTPSYVSQI